jgi:hypothetical protein
MATMEEVAKYAQDGQLEGWIDAFLRAEGNNVPLADGLKKQKRYWIGPLQFPLKIAGLKKGWNTWNLQKLGIRKLIRSSGISNPAESTLPLSCSTARAFSRFETAVIGTEPMRNWAGKHTGR